LSNLKAVMSNLKAVIIQFTSEDLGQDMVEYALLAAFIGLAGFVVLRSLGIVISAAYTGWDSGVQGLWEPPPPQ